MRHKFHTTYLAGKLEGATRQAKALLHLLKALGNLKRRPHQHLHRNQQHHRQLINSTLLYICILVSSVSSQLLYNLNEGNHNDNNHHRHYSNDNSHYGKTLRVNCNHSEHSGKSQHQPSDTESHSGHQLKSTGSHQRQLSRRLAISQAAPPAQSVPDSTPLHKQLAAASYNTQVGRSSNLKPCNGCLAIPLVAILGNRQANGFIIPQLRKHSSYTPYPVRAIQPQKIDGVHGYNNEHYDGSHSLGRCVATAPSYGTHPMPIVHPLEPRSDEKCPMTGPLTVCDQIGSYPADVILHKLDLVRKNLQSSCFNINSLFTDERDHSKEPFEDELNVPMAIRQPSSITNFSPDRDSSDDTIANYTNTYSPSKNASLGVYPETIAINHKPQIWAGNPQQQPIQGFKGRMRESNPDQGSQRSLVGHNTPLYSVGHLKNSENKASASAPSVSDFLELVEQQALSLGVRETDPLAAGRHEAETNRFKSSTLPPVSTSVNSSSLADRLLSLSHLSDQTSESNANGRGGSPASQTKKPKYSQPQRQDYYHQQQSNLLPQFKSVDTISNIQLQPTKRFGKSPLTRHRRQAAAGVAVVGGEQSSGELNPSSVSDSSEGEGQPEPLCRVKSIYISPKAALNDKKQWKYVVNAPELNPQIRQIIRVDICEIYLTSPLELPRDPFGPCSEQVSIPFGFTSQCKQKYSKKKLLALDSESGQLEVDTFFIPSCCVCQLIRASPIAEELAQPDDVNTEPPAVEDAT